MTRTLASSLLAAAIAVVSVSPAATAQTFGSSSVDIGIGPLGRLAGAIPPVKGSVAETFTTPAGSPLLQSFTFFLTGWDGSPPDLLVEASIFKFVVDHVDGGPLFTTLPQAGSSDLSGAYDPITFSGLNWLLTPGTLYALVLRPSSGSPDGATNLVGATFADSFLLGDLFTSEGTTNGELEAGGAFVASDPSIAVDAALQVTFGPAPGGPGGVVPEPGSFVLLATGIVGVVGFVRRRATRPKA